MEIYCETSESKGFRDTRRETVVTTLSKYIKQILQVDPTFTDEHVGGLLLS